MTLNIGAQDEFEGAYIAKFKQLAQEYAEFMNYERDRAAIDLGLHLKIRATGRNKVLTQTRVWVQFKGIQTSTLSLEEYQKISRIAVDLEIDHLRFWYASPEAVYLIVYIEAANEFLAEDVREIVEPVWGDGIFRTNTFRPGQKKARVRISKRSVVNNDFWEKLRQHRGLRIDGPDYRGRPLGHRFDPLRCTPNKMEPSTFQQVVSKVLSVHKYSIHEQLDPHQIFVHREAGDQATLTLGWIGFTFEWIPQFTVPVGQSILREGAIEHMFHAQGPCAVLIHSQQVTYPERNALLSFADRLIQQNIRHFLVFYNNRNDPAYFGSFYATLRRSGLKSCVPQDLGTLAYNILTATNVYLMFREQVSWEIANYLYDEPE